MNVLTNFGRSFFQTNEDKITPIIPIQDMDVELGANLHLPENVCNNLEMKQGKLDNPDLELGFGPIVEMSNKHIIIRMQSINDNNVVDKYYSLFDSLNYINMSLNNKNKTE